MQFLRHAVQSVLVDLLNGLLETGTSIQATKPHIPIALQIITPSSARHCHDAPVASKMFLRKPTSRIVSTDQLFRRMLKLMHFPLSPHNS
jgi:hypothetical protein